MGQNFLMEEVIAVLGTRHMYVELIFSGMHQSLKTCEQKASIENPIIEKYFW